MASSVFKVPAAVINSKVQVTQDDPTVVKKLSVNQETTYLHQVFRIINAFDQRLPAAPHSTTNPDGIYYKTDTGLGLPSPLHFPPAYYAHSANLQMSSIQSMLDKMVTRQLVLPQVKCQFEKSQMQEYKLIQMRPPPK